MSDLINQLIENLNALAVALLGLFALYQKVRRMLEGKTLESVIRGVERGTTRLDPEAAKALKREIQSEALKAKAEDHLKAQVKKVREG